MNIKPLKTNDDYEQAVARLDELMDATPGTEAGDELDVLATLIEAYEAKHFPIESADPVEAVLFRMEQLNLDRSDLQEYLGGKPKVSEVLNRKRELSLTMIRKLHAGLKIPYENLIKDSA